MRAGFRAASWSFIVLVFGLATSTSTAQSQDTESQQDQRTTSNRSSGSLPGQATGRTQSPEESTPAHQEPSRWERLRDSLSPFRPRKPKPDGDRQEDRRRWLIGRKVQYAPERASDSANGDDVKPDLSVLRASYELRQEPSLSTSSP